MSSKPIPLNEFIILQRGHDLPQKDRADGDIPVVASTGIAGYHNEAKAKAPGVVIGRSGSIGGGQYITQDFWPLNTTLWVKDFNGHNERFIYYLLRSIDFSSFNVGSGVPTLNRNHLSSILIDDKGRQFEDEVAKILGDIDDKIELNTQTNQTLEQMAQAIFKSWFVDFDPVKAKMETLAAGGSNEDAELAAMSAISAKTIDELHSMKASNPEAFANLAETAALFPAAVQDSELGEIPEGWEVKTLSSMIRLTGGGTPKRSEEKYWNGDIPWFSVRDVPSDGNVFVVDTEEKITELGLKKSSTKILPKGTTIITARGTVGKLALVGTDMCMNQSCYGIRGKEVGDFYNYFNLKEAVATLQRNTHGAVFDTITTKTFDTYSLAFGGLEIANSFDGLIAPLLQKVEGNGRQNRELAALRDTFLPKLLSGEVELNEI
ncbi:restriction endonuclease subunit S [Pseudidiomarina donghaiensis]|uniref:Type I restriction endonuclease subunit M n=1 Tax=Pseudidiomarina donghaiensis TaxID=519452 RepID=A0A432XAU7_9GAMM|nr:restriction endonuclease subunit S [Pseudidiomarina donghaiensis]RUO45874.1 type I restriction endonuclease subunit M [Pseudidiomarina donghaiensis]SFV25118.1 type I restriction enzyme, S subunit [Pseudidiomarina donghaiensis]